MAITPYYRKLTDNTQTPPTTTYVSDTNLPTPSEVRNRWCFGLNLNKDDGSVMTDDDIMAFLTGAITSVEQKLGVYLKPKIIACDPDARGLVQGTDYEVEEAPYDYDIRQYGNWGFMQLRQRHVQKLTGLKMVLPNGLMIVDFMTRPEWVKLYKESGQLHIVPYAGDPTIFAILGGSVTGYPMVTGQMNSNMPQMFYVDYEAGYGLQQIPDNIRNVVAKLAAIDVLGIAGTAFQAGVGNVSTSMDGLSESVSQTAYTDQVKKLQSEVDSFFDPKDGGGRSMARGITMTAL